MSLYIYDNSFPIFYLHSFDHEFETASINMIKSWRNTCTVVSLCVMTIMVVNSPKNHLQYPSHI